MIFLLVFKVCEFFIIDFVFYLIILRWKIFFEDGIGECEVFCKNYFVLFLKVIIFYKKELFELEVFYINLYEVFYFDVRIGSFII